MSQLITGVFMFAVMHFGIWWSANAQFIDGWDKKTALTLSILMSIPITLLAFFASRYTYYALDEKMWTVRFLAFGMSYLIFPVLTWLFLNETPFTAKTIVCTILSVLIIFVQLRY